MTNPPPEAQHRALLHLLKMAIFEARLEAWKGEAEAAGEMKERFEKIAKLMDIVHNLPGFLIDYSGWKQDYFETVIESNDLRGKYKVGSWAKQVYEKALEEAGE